jgi:isoquinoline 1-oxidoreductase alpha subunit
MRDIQILVNGQAHTVTVEPDMPLLWVLRDLLGLIGTRFGCGVGLCGACTVHLQGNPVRSCVTPISVVGNQAVTTIEGLSPDRSHPLQRAWIAEEAPQGGYCQSGQLMTAEEQSSISQAVDDSAMVSLRECGELTGAAMAALKNNAPLQARLKDPDQFRLGTDELHRLRAGPAWGRFNNAIFRNIPCYASTNQHPLKFISSQGKRPQQGWESPRLCAPESDLLPRSHLAASAADFQCANVPVAKPAAGRLRPAWARDC